MLIVLYGSNGINMIAEDETAGSSFFYYYFFGNSCFLTPIKKVLNSYSAIGCA